MADWRQIQARIRKAKASTDAAAKLAELYERTRDAMVAFELARFQEKAGEHAEAARWYTAAAERFRRSQWKTKAEAALARLRNPGAASAADKGAAASEDEDTRDMVAPEAADAVPSEDSSEAESSAAISEPPEAQEEAVIPASAASANLSAESPQAAATDAQSDELARKRSRRRGRRGGRNRRRSGKRPESAVPMARSHAGATVTPPAEETAESAALPLPSPAEAPPAPSASEVSSPAVGSAVAAWRDRSRAGEPALASRMAQLESQLRRLLACPQAKLDQADQAPAGPGVLLLSDSDQVTHYYVESCQTLRIAVGNLIRGGRAAKDLPQLKPRLAENLGIAESRVTHYLKEHCAVRWLQLDEGASELAHFAIAVLRPVVND